ncbi:type IV toxin-antitoxin system AbiEi family antitoxin domain-containing protein [Specibacter sp. NPDC057265]|uniref:type IV toxin-antitoxin system AbiEi family antitoxin domain-containing protein n=1 Tax=Specibacter sp. NPDC057265 TaxID=3346075 RepID=UPI0036260C3E
MRERRGRTRRGTRRRGDIRGAGHGHVIHKFAQALTSGHVRWNAWCMKSQLILPEDMALQGRDSRYLAKLQQRGQLVRIRRGAYVNAATWENLDSATQYGLKSAAFQARSQRPPVFCHATAALLWGLWLVGKPQKIHIITASRAGGRSHHDVSAHPGSLTCNVVQCGGLLLTDKLTTTLQLITGLPFEHAVAICDSSLHSPWRPKLENIFSALGSRHPRRSSRAVLAQ